MSIREQPVVLTIAGIDPTGGAGTIADVKTIHACGGYAIAAVTALTVQNALQGVTAVEATRPDILRAQLDAVASERTIDAVKVGMVATAEQVEAIREWYTSTNKPPLVIDPVLRASAGGSLSTESTSDALFALCQLATLVTPNTAEAEILLACASGEFTELYDAFTASGADTALVVTGGDTAGTTVTDTLLYRNTRYTYSRKRTLSSTTHGTGCTFSSCAATLIGRGENICDAVEAAGRYTAAAISAGIPLQQGRGGIGHPLWGEVCDVDR